MELKRFFEPRASFVSGVSWHVTRVFFGFYLTCTKKILFDIADIESKTPEHFRLPLQ
jgi:hypothetical protein